jgi:hypothetical protein
MYKDKFFSSIIPKNSNSQNAFQANRFIENDIFLNPMVSKGNSFF